MLWALLGVLAWNVCTHCSDQVALQRYFTTTSLSAARKSFLVNIVSAVHDRHAAGDLRPGPAVLLSAARRPAAAGLSPTSGADQLMPFFYAYQLPAGFGGLILVSFLCDAMQTLGSGVNSIAAVITKDVVGDRDASNGGGVRSARLVTLGVGRCRPCWPCWPPAYAMHAGKSIFDMLPRMFNMFLGPLAVMFMIGMFYRRATAPVILSVVLFTQILSSAWSWWGEVPLLLEYLGQENLADGWISLLGIDSAGKPRTPSVMLAVAGPTVFGLATGAVLSRLFGREEHPARISPGGP